MPQTPSTGSSAVLSFDQFWRWVQRHPNCILRAATPEVVVYDDEDLHWHFDRGDAGLVLVEVIRGKRLLADIAIQSTDVELVQSGPGEENEVVFDLFLRGAEGDPPAYTFVMSHGYEGEEGASGSGRWIH